MHEILERVDWYWNHIKSVSSQSLYAIMQVNGVIIPSLHSPLELLVLSITYAQFITGCGILHTCLPHTVYFVQSKKKKYIYIWFCINGWKTSRNMAFETCFYQVSNPHIQSILPNNSLLSMKVAAWFFIREIMRFALQCRGEKTPISNKYSSSTFLPPLP